MYIHLIQYIPYQASHLDDKFLVPAVHAILTAIETLTIIRTRSGNWIRPGHALIVPPQLMFDNEPLFTETELKYGITKSYEYVDPEYQELKIHPILTKIDCQTLSHSIVFSIVSNDRFPFSNKPYRWFAVLFQYLYRNSSNLNFCQYYKPLYLQLASGEWTSKASRDVYFPAISLDIDFSNLNIAVLHRNFYREIEANEYAGLFLTRILKIKTLSDSEIIRAIIDYHSRSPSTFDVQMCFDHALYLSQRRYLFSQGDLPSFAESFHLVDHLDHVVAGCSNVLIDREIQMTPHVLLSRICTSSSFHFLSSKYPPGVVDFLIRYLTLACGSL